MDPERDDAQQDSQEQNPFASFQTETYDRGELVPDEPAEPAEPAEEDEAVEPAEEDREPPEGVQRPQEDAQDGREGGEEQADPPPRKKSVQERINELTRARREAERRAEALEARIREIERQQAPPTQKQEPTPAPAPVTKPAAEAADPEAPKPEDYEYGELDPRYITALAVHGANQRFAELRAEEQQRQAEAQAREQQSRMVERVDKMLDAGSKKHDDYYEKVIIGAEQGVWPLSAELGELILESDVGHDIAYHLATHPEEAHRVNSASPMEQARYFGRLEAKFSAERAAAPATGGKPAPRTPKAPPPVEGARGAGGSFQPSADTDDFAAFEKRVMSQG